MLDTLSSSAIGSRFASLVSLLSSVFSRLFRYCLESLCLLVEARLDRKAMCFFMELSASLFIHVFFLQRILHASAFYRFLAPDSAQSLLEAMQSIFSLVFSIATSRIYGRREGNPVPASASWKHCSLLYDMFYSFSPIYSHYPHLRSFLSSRIVDVCFFLHQSTVSALRGGLSRHFGGNGQVWLCLLYKTYRCSLSLLEASASDFARLSESFSAFEI